MKISVLGQIHNFSGFAVHTRNLCLALLKEGVELNIETQVPQEFLPTVPVELFPYLNKPNFKPDVDLLITLPEAWPFKTVNKTSKLMVGYGIFEGTKLCYNWLKRASDPNIDLILVPSEHTKKAFEPTGKPIEIVPHGFNPDIFNINVPKAVNLNNGKFKFLYVGGWADGIKDRRGLDIALRAFCEEFKKEEPVQFLVKINNSYQHPDKVMTDIKNLGLGEPAEHPEISLIFENYDDKTMASIYRTADITVIPSKAEAFCLPLLESLACGIPVITTNYGGVLDYVTEENGWLIDIEGMAKATGGSTYENAEWAIPSKEHLRKLMRSAYETNKPIKPITDLTWANTAKKILVILERELNAIH